MVDLAVGSNHPGSPLNPDLHVDCSMPADKILHLLKLLFLNFAMLKFKVGKDKRNIFHI